LKGGGRDDCEMRVCASEKGAVDCTECDDRARCKHSEILENMSAGALAAGLFVRENEKCGDDLIREWSAKLESKWPSCVLFMDDT
jgi:hypothetical protein